MSRLGGAFWFVVVIATGVTNFVVKQTVQNLDDQLASVRKKTIVAQKEIHELNADWTFLNQPELLADLNKRHVGLAPISPKQLVGIDSLPLRPAPPPDAAAQIATVAPPHPPSAVEPVAAPIPTAPAPVTEPQIAAATEPDPAALEPAAATAAPSPAVVPLDVSGAPAAIPAAASAAPPPPARPLPIVKVAATAPPHPAPSLDALFAQVAGDR